MSSRPLGMIEVGDFVRVSIFDFSIVTAAVLASGFSRILIELPVSSTIRPVCTLPSLVSMM